VKWFPFILSLYILGLSCLPCGDNAVCAEDAATLDITASGHDDHEHQADLCSPFCVCICCGMTFTPGYDKIPVTEIPPVHQTIIPSHTNFFTPEVYINIWQPPKLG
jgi:hypothetical protein